MSIKTYRPTSPARRQMSVSGFDGVDKHAKPEKSLIEVVKKNSGRNSYGRITVRHKGGGNRRKYRVIDFRRDKLDMPGKVLRLEYDPNRTAFIALTEYEDGERRYILAPVGLAAGDTVHQAFEGAYRDTCLQYGEGCDLAQELQQILLAPQSGLSLEVMLQDFAQRSGLEDIESFSNVFSVCYATGGNMKDVMRRTHDIITDKMAISAEIETKLTSNRLELNIITVAPIFLMLLLRFTNQSFAEKFATPGGVVCVTIAIAIFVAAFRMGRKIIDIKG